MTDQELIKKVYEFIKTRHLAVLSWVNKEALPESSVIGFSENGDCVLFFGTYDTSRKYANFRQNRMNVSVVIGWEHGKTVQLEGVVERITEQEIEKVKKDFLAKIPTAAKYVEAVHQRFFKIVPKWIRYSDLSKDPWDVFEIRF